MTEQNQRSQVMLAAQALADIARQHHLILSHGNGPQVGLLSLQNEAFEHEVPPYPLDNLGAQSQAMIGYLFVQAMKSVLPDKCVVSLLTQSEVDPQDPAFQNPTKFIGPIYEEDQAKTLERTKGWCMKLDGQHWRRVVASPRPKRIIEWPAIEALVNAGVLVIATGGGGVPVIATPTGLQGLEAVIDKDFAGALLAQTIHADKLMIATDVDGVYVDWGTPDARRITRVHPEVLGTMGFAAGSMGPKVEAAIRFAQSGGEAIIGPLTELRAMLEHRAGTLVSQHVEGIEYAQ